MGSESSSSCFPTFVGSHESSAAWVAFCRCSLVVGFSEVSRASKKAVVAVSITVSSRASRGCSGQSPAVAAP